MSLRLNRPPTRVYVTFDELGPNKARTRKVDAINEADPDTGGDATLFGETNVFEYRLVSRTARANLKPKVP